MAEQQPGTDSPRPASTTLDPETGVVREKGAHVKIDGERGVWVQPVDMLVAQEVDNQFQAERLEAFQEAAEREGFSVQEYRAELDRRIERDVEEGLDREEAEDKHRVVPEFSEELCSRLEKTLLDCITGWDELLVGHPDDPTRPISPDDAVGDGKGSTALEVMARHWARRRPVLANHIVQAAARLSSEVQGNSEGGAGSTGDGEKAAPRAIPSGATAAESPDESTIPGEVIADSSEGEGSRA